MMPATLSILTNVFTPEERPKAIAIWAGVTGVGVAIGPVTGGFLLSHFWWGSIFLINVPVAVVAIVAGLAIVPTSRDPDPRPLDRVGTLLSAVGLGSLLYGIIEAPTYGWHATNIVAAGLAGIVLIGGFVWWELHSTHPMLDMRLFTNPRFSAASVAIALLFFALFGTLFVVTQYLQDVLGFTALQTGLREAPVALALMAAAPLTPVLVARLGTKIVVVAGLAVIAASLVLITRIDPESSSSSATAMVLIAIVGLGLGLGLALAPATESIMGSVPPERAGVGSATNDTTREVGGALGVAVLGSVLNSVFRTHLQGSAVTRLLPPEVQAAAVRSVGEAKSVAATLGSRPGSALARAADAAFVHAMAAAAAIGALVALGGLAVALAALPARPAPADQELNELALAAAGASAVPRATIVHRVLRVLAYGAHASLAFNGIASRLTTVAIDAQSAWGRRLHHLAGELEAIPGVSDAMSRSLVWDIAKLLDRAVATVRRELTVPDLVALFTAVQQEPGHANTTRFLLSPLRNEIESRLTQATVSGDLPDSLDTSLLADELVGLAHRGIAQGSRGGRTDGGSRQAVHRLLWPHLRDPSGDRPERPAPAAFDGDTPGPERPTAPDST